MQPPKLIASDVDGTLLRADNTASRRTIDAVRRLAAVDVPLVLVTGRPPRWMPPVVEQLDVTGVAVCANGAVIYDLASEIVVHTELLDPVVQNDVVSVLDKILPGCHYAVERITSGPMRSVGEEFLAEPGYQHTWLPPDSAAVPRGVLLGEPAAKLLVRHAAMTSEAMATAAAVLADSVHITYSTGNGLVEISAPGATKAHGLARVAGDRGVDPADVVAFGDMPNDIAMLRWAGHGVAMANAHTAVVHAADEVTESVSDDGVALVLERWF